MKTPLPPLQAKGGGDKREDKNSSKAKSPSGYQLSVFSLMKTVPAVCCPVNIFS